MDPADPDVRVVRLAVVMTGGVSLAVWIGGVVAEIYRAVRGAGIYGALCRETRSLVAVDVITGASAGGVNGAFLSAALAYGLDEQAFDGLRDVWLRDGGFDKLLRHPHEKDPPSLLRGDAYFLAQLGEELARWVPTERRQVDADPPPIHLAMTVTTLSSEPHVFRDDLGTKIVEPVHRARFTFTDDHFATPRGLAAKLALAARATASFPGAFEPALIPVGGPLRPRRHRPAGHGGHRQLRQDPVGHRRWRARQPTGGAGAGGDQGAARPTARSAASCCTSTPTPATSPRPRTSPAAAPTTRRRCRR